jgi:hypothetical protein
MSPWFVIETLLLALVFFASFLVAWDAIHSDSLRRARTDLALALLAPSRPGLIRRLGRFIAPRPRPGLAAPAKSCGGCTGDGTKGGCG